MRLLCCHPALAAKMKTLNMVTSLFPLHMLACEKRSRLSVHDFLFFFYQAYSVYAWAPTATLPTIPTIACKQRTAVEGTHAS